MVIQVSCCVACLSPVEPHFRQVKPGLVNIYKSLILPVAEQIPVDLCIFFCNNCEGNLLHFDQFRSNCVTSLVNLVNIAGIKETYRDESSTLKYESTTSTRRVSLERSAEILKMIQNPVLNGHVADEKVEVFDVVILQDDSNVGTFEEEVLESISDSSLTEPDPLPVEAQQNVTPEPTKEVQQPPKAKTKRTPRQPKKATAKRQGAKLQLQCIYCKAEFTNRKILNKHVTEHLHLKLECHFCGKQMARASLPRHLYQHIVDPPYRCNHCKKPNYTKADHEAHMAYEERKRERDRRTCELCGYVATRMSVLRLHMASKHEGELDVPRKRVTCEKCGKILKIKSYNTHMMLKHSTDKSDWLPCSQCNRLFATPRLLRLHVSREHELTNCQICKKSVGNGSLKKHIDSVHPNLRQWECPIVWCNLVFKVEVTLVKHLFVHTNTRPYNCTMCTTRGYYNTEYLKNHYNKAHNVTEVKQEWLKYQFPNLSRIKDPLKQHLAAHTKICLEKIRTKCEIQAKGT